MTVSSQKFKLGIFTISGIYEFAVLNSVVKYKLNSLMIERKMEDDKKQILLTLVDLDSTGDLVRKSDQLNSFFDKIKVYDINFNQSELIKTEDDSSKLLFLVEPNVIFFKCPRHVMQDLIEAFKDSLPDEKFFENAVRFDKNFLNWLLFQSQQEEPFLDEFKIIKIKEIKMENVFEDACGRWLKVSSRKNAGNAIPVRIAQLQMYMPTQITFLINLSNIKLEFSIDFKGHLKIFVSKGTLRGKSDSERMVAGAFLIYTLINTYNKWNNMGPNEKFPTEENLDLLIENLVNDGFISTEDSDSIYQDYNQKRKNQR